MKLLGLLIIVGIFIGFLRFVIGSVETQVKPGPRHAPPYEKCKTLYTPAERSFLGVLEQALGVEYRVFGKIRLGDVIQPKIDLSSSHFFAVLNKMNKKHLDFVICSKNNCEILGVIELDGSSEDRQDRKKGDQFVDMALDVSGIPVLHLSAQQSYQVQDLRTTLVHTFALDINGALPKDTEKSESKVLQEAIAQPIGEERAVGAQRKLVTATKKIAEEHCPECGSIMRTGKVARGPHQGKHFSVCAKYPACKTLKRGIEQVA